ncbi:hypothetical protein [Clostridium chromiireducens]|uniref:hypothetical protein n=1 Tax=Clostridium chromiireducens TaxID=225345 RepID=UPI00311A9308
MTIIIEWIFQLVYKLLLTFNATSMILVVYFIKERYYFCGLYKFPIWVSFIVCMLFPVLTTGISLFFKKFLSYDSIEKTPLDIEQANNSFLPSYLGYFFVALSVPTSETFWTAETLWFVYFILFVFTFCSQTIYFNPIFLIFGYQFYNMTTADNIKIFLISRKQIKTTKELLFPTLKRINNFTFIDIEKAKEDNDESCNS